MTDDTTKSALLSDHERIQLLERIVFDLSQHAACLEGAVKVLDHLMVGSVLRRATEDAEPYRWLQDYVAASAAGCRQIKPNAADPTTFAYVRAGIDLAASGFFRRLLERSDSLDGAPKGPLANI
jgi:hypothetical protein